MKQKFYWSDWAIEKGALAIRITDDMQKVLDEYLETKNVKTLERIMDEKPAHTVDVIFKESERTYVEEDPYEGKDFFTTCFHTPYALFDKDKVFWRNDDEECKKFRGFWSFPISVCKKNGKWKTETDFCHHNFFYPCLIEVRFDDDGLLDGFYQDIDIFGTDETWKPNLIKALTRVVMAVYDYWKEHHDDEGDLFIRNLEKKRSDE